MTLTHRKRILVIGLCWLFGLPTLFFTVIFLFQAKAVLGNWLLPAEVVLYVLDDRVNGNFLEDFQGTYTINTGKERSSKKLLIRRVGKDEVITSFSKLLVSYEQTLQAPSSSKLFLSLPPPLGDSLKVLRSEIDSQERFVGADRASLLDRIVVLSFAELGSAEKPCDRLEDSWLYMHWNFEGVGLVVDNTTADLIDYCLPGLIELTL